MDYKKLLFVTFFLIGFLLVFGNNQAFCQNTAPKEAFEEVYEHWFYTVDKFQLNSGLKKDEYALFSRFSEKSLDSLRGDFIQRIGRGEVTLSNVEGYENVLIKGIETIYKKFEKIKQSYPSSVEEYRHVKTYPSQVCNSACNNIDFETGDLSGWYAYYGFNQSYSSTNITNITGGLAGAVTNAANDTLTSTPGYYNAAAGVPPNPKPDYQVSITSGSRGDAIIPSIPVVSPFGGKYSVMIGDSTLPNYGFARLSQTFQVDPASANLTYQYAVFLANPASHNYYQQPYFSVVILDAAGDTIPHCGEYNVVSGTNVQGFDTITYRNASYDGPFIVYYKNWSMVNVSLKRYIGQCVTVRFEVGDCGLGGHFGYAYVDASCSPLAIISSSQYFCGQDSLTLTGPAGESSYKWIGPAGGIISNDTLRHINVVDTGIYTVIVTPFTGAFCNDTLTIHITQKIGYHPPKPSFSADTVCVGATTTFTNNSNPLSGASFYWDFYNIGSYQDSSINPTWTYNIPGIYTVKLHEVVSGCGKDTLIKVVVDSLVAPSFMANTVCMRDTLHFINTSTGANSFKWNFGDTLSGANNKSTNINPYHIYDTAGTYAITLVGNNPGKCGDSIKQTVVVLPLPNKPTVTGADSICYGSSTVLTASGALSYIWSTGATTSSITVNPTVNTTYTVTGSNGICSNDTAVTVYIKPILSGTILASPPVCLGDTIHISATGGGTYFWSTGATTSSISVLAASTSDTTYSVTISNRASCISLSEDVVIDSIVKPSFIANFICAKDTIYFINTSTGATSFKWNFGDPASGANNISTLVNPYHIYNTAGTYTVTLVGNNSGNCSDSIKQPIIVLPLPNKPSITGSDTICSGSSTVLTAGGSVSYRWSTGATTTSITVNPTTTTTYTVTGSNGTCSNDTIITVYVKPILSGTINGPNVCLNDTIHLTATGGGTYLWSTGATTSSISVLAASMNDTTYSVTINNGGSCISISKSITIYPLPVTAVCCSDTIYAGDSVMLQGSGGVGYYWIPPTGLSCDTCPNPIASPTTTTTYTLVAISQNGCISSNGGELTIGVEEAPCGDFFIPNVFTPNGDGIDDTYLVRAPVEDYEISIYNRWGQEIFHSYDPTDPWNGNVHNKDGLPAPQGVYFYIIKAVCFNGKAIKKVGHLQLIRKN